MEASKQRFTQSIEQTRIRQWFRLSKSRWPFVPWGLISLLGLLTLLLFGVSAFARGTIIERDNWVGQCELFAAEADASKRPEAIAESSAERASMMRMNSHEPARVIPDSFGETAE